MKPTRKRTKYLIGDNMTRGKLLQNGTGKGTRANRGRGGCKPTEPQGKGQTGDRPRRMRRW